MHYLIAFVLALGCVACMLGMFAMMPLMNRGRRSRAEHDQ